MGRRAAPGLGRIALTQPTTGGRRRGATLATALVAVAVAVACSVSRPHLAAPAPTTRHHPPASTVAAATTSTSAPLSCATRVWAGLSEGQRVGQLFMIGEPMVLPDAATRQALRDQAVGGVVLYGRSRAPAPAIRALTDGLRAIAAPVAGPAGLFIATDQEGGQVQNLAGAGFDAMPPAVVQGTIDPTRLEGDAGRWGAELGQAGVNVDLAPVLDVVPAPFSQINQPIAHYQRQFGDQPAAVAVHGAAVVRGLQAAGVAATLKHFPGLGRVAGNTDDVAGVTDTTTTGRDLASFAAGIGAGARLVLVSLATYTQIDPANRAVFSSVVLRDLLRGELGFHGLVISDDLGAAAAVQDVAPAARAVRFLAAGGTIVLVVKPVSIVAPMAAAVLARAAADPAFRQVVDTDTRAVLGAKEAAGLLACP